MSVIRIKEMITKVEMSCSLKNLLTCIFPTCIFKKNGKLLRLQNMRVYRFYTTDHVPVRVWTAKTSTEIYVQDMTILILRLMDLTLNPWAPKLNIAHFLTQDFSHVLHVSFCGCFCCSHPYWDVNFTVKHRYKTSSLLFSCSTPRWSLCDQTKPVGE